MIISLDHIRLSNTYEKIKSVEQLHKTRLKIISVNYDFRSFVEILKEKGEDHRYSYNIWLIQTLIMLLRPRVYKKRVLNCNCI